MSTEVSVTVVCDACGRSMTTSRTTSTGARGDASRHGWRVSRQAHPSAPLSNDPKRRDECPVCRTDVDRSKPEGAPILGPDLRVSDHVTSRPRTYTFRLNFEDLPPNPRKDMP